MHFKWKATLEMTFDKRVFYQYCKLIKYSSFQAEQCFKDGVSINQEHFNGYLWVFLNPLYLLNTYGGLFLLIFVIIFSSMFYFNLLFFFRLLLSGLCSLMQEEFEDGEQILDSATYIFPDVALTWTLLGKSFEENYEIF